MASAEGSELMVEERLESHEAIQLQDRFFVENTLPLFRCCRYIQEDAIITTILRKDWAMNLFIKVHCIGCTLYTIVYWTRRYVGLSSGFEGPTN